MPGTAGRAAIGIVGAGSLGQAYAALLARAGDDVVLVASPASAARLQAAGQVSLTGAITADVAVGAPGARGGTLGVTDDPAALGAVDGVIFATKAHQLRRAAADVAYAMAPQADRPWWVAGVQNGLIKDEILGDAFSEARLVGAVSILGAGRESDGTVRIGGLGMTYLGEFDPPPAAVTARVHDLVGRLVAAGIPAAGVPDIRSVLWSKACNAVGVFGVSVLTRLAGPQMWANSDLVRAFRALVRETDAVAKASGVTVGDYRGFPIRTYLQMTASEHVEYAAGLVASAPAGPVAPGAYPSMTQDLLAGRPMEIEEVFGDVVAKAERLGVEVPRITLVSDLLRGLNAAITG